MQTIDLWQCMKFIHNNIRTYTKFYSKGCVFMGEKKNEIILFENQGVKLEVNLRDETVWLTQKQMAELFDKDISRILIRILQAIIYNK